jgi:hypothetical protein
MWISKKKKKFQRTGQLGTNEAGDFKPILIYQLKILGP